jgi:hypothetical protein
MKMGKIASTARTWTGTFCDLQEHSRNFNEINDCAVKAVAVACGVDYPVAHAALKAAGRKDRKGASIKTILKAFEALGFAARPWTFKDQKDFIALYPGRAKLLQSITTHHPERFRRVWEDAVTEPTMIFTNGHVAAYRDGKIHDWSRGRALRAWAVCSITKI